MVNQSSTSHCLALPPAVSKLHQLLSAATPGFHRLGAAAFALGAAAAILLLVLLVSGQGQEPPLLDL